jgi:hypothetical protein
MKTHKIVEEIITTDDENYCDSHCPMFELIMNKVDGEIGIYCRVFDSVLKYDKAAEKYLICEDCRKYITNNINNKLVKGKKK